MVWSCRGHFGFVSNYDVVIFRIITNFIQHCGYKTEKLYGVTYDTYCLTTITLMAMEILVLWLYHVRYDTLNYLLRRGLWHTWLPHITHLLIVNDQIIHAIFIKQATCDLNVLYSEPMTYCASSKLPNLVMRYFSQTQGFWLTCRITEMGGWFHVLAWVNSQLLVRWWKFMNYG